MMSDQVRIFDTTLRDGEQAPGCSMDLSEKLEVALALERMKVDVIEAGFAIASKGDFKSVEEISKLIKNCTIASLSPRDQKGYRRGVGCGKAGQITADSYVLGNITHAYGV